MVVSTAQYFVVTVVSLASLLFAETSSRAKSGQKAARLKILSCLLCIISIFWIFLLTLTSKKVKFPYGGLID